MLLLLKLKFMVYVRVKTLFWVRKLFLFCKSSSLKKKFMAKTFLIIQKEKKNGSFDLIYAFFVSVNFIIQLICLIQLFASNLLHIQFHDSNAQFNIHYETRLSWHLRQTDGMKFKVFIKKEKNRLRKTDRRRIRSCNLNEPWKEEYWLAVGVKSRHCFIWNDKSRRANRKPIKFTS